MSEPIVTIARFSLLTEAQGVKSRLERANIPSWIIDDSVGGSLPGLGDTLGGIALQIREEDYERAEVLLAPLLGGNADEAGLADPRAWTCTMCQEAVSGDLTACPWCGASKAAFQTQLPASDQAITTALEEDDEEEEDVPTTSMEQAASRVVTSPAVRNTLVALLVGPTLIFLALGLLALLVAGLVSLFGVL